MNRILKLLVVAGFATTMFSFPTLAQDLRNSFWIRVKMERKDGSKLINRDNEADRLVGYRFSEKKFYPISGGDSVDFLVVGKKIMIRNIPFYDIETANDSLLTITEIPDNVIPDDNYNRLYLINRRYFRKYIVRNNLVNLNADPIVANRFLQPGIGSDFNFFNKLKRFQKNGFFKGNFIVTNDGKMGKLTISENKSMSPKDTEKFKELLTSTDGHWISPPNIDKSFLVNFKCEFHKDAFSSWANFVISEKDQPRRIKQLHFKEMDVAKARFNNGIQFSMDQKFDKAVVQFSKCLAIDSLFLDAYYNRAFAYYKMDSLKAACNNWRTLKDMGQKRGENIYNQKCLSVN